MWILPDHSFTPERWGGLLINCAQHDTNADALQEPGGQWERVHRPGDGRASRLLRASESKGERCPLTGAEPVSNKAG